MAESKLFVILLTFEKSIEMSNVLDYRFSDLHSMQKNGRNFWLKLHDFFQFLHILA